MFYYKTFVIEGNKRKNEEKQNPPLPQFSQALRREATHPSLRSLSTKALCWVAYLALLYGLGRDCSAHALLNRHSVDEHKLFWWWKEGFLLLTKI